MKNGFYVLLASALILSVGYGNDFANQESIPVGHEAEISNQECLRLIFLSCRHVGEPGAWDDLKTLAETRHLTQEDMYALLTEQIQDGLAQGAGWEQYVTAMGCLAALATIPGEHTHTFAKELMRTTNDNGVRNTAVQVAVSTMPEKWDELFREILGTKHFDHLTRYYAYESAYDVGKAGNAGTRRHVQEVLKDLATKEEVASLKKHLLEWARELDEGQVDCGQGACPFVAPPVP